MTGDLFDGAVQANVRSAIERAVEEWFEGRDIYAVEVTRDADPDGGELFTVKIVLHDDADLQRFGGNRLAGLIRHLRRSLEKEGESAFPLVRMMSKRDSELLSSETY
jgi:hypothetical protein